jgi:hypothetical protein
MPFAKRGGGVIVSTPSTHEPERAIVVRTEMEPNSASDSPSKWRSFVDGLRRLIGLKPIHMAERWAGAKITSVEVENQAKILKARGDYELIQAQIRKMDQETAATQGTIEAQVRTAVAKASQEESKARILRSAAQQIQNRNITVEQAAENLQRIINVIEYQHGGRVEIQLPDSTGDSTEPTSFSPNSLSRPNPNSQSTHSAHPPAGSPPDTTSVERRVGSSPDTHRPTSPQA